MRRIAWAALALGLAVPLPLQSQPTETWSEYEGTCTSVVSWTCWKIRIRTVTSTAGTAVSIFVQNLQTASSPVTDVPLLLQSFTLQALHLGTLGSPPATPDAGLYVSAVATAQAVGDNNWDGTTWNADVPSPVNPQAAYTVFEPLYSATWGIFGCYVPADYTLGAQFTADELRISGARAYTLATPGAQVTPEPVTLVLLAGGLAGIGAAARRRRRNAGRPVEET
jgi:hypothetical protein